MKSVLFICLGNICRSPAAEGILQALVKHEGLEGRIKIDSAGTSAYHAGSPADERMRSFAKERGYDLTSISRQFRAPSDFHKFDYILTMDGRNFQDVIDEDPHEEFRSKVIPMTQFCKIHNVHQVPDPYYQGDDGFRLVLDILEDACEGLLAHLKAELGITKGEKK
jgi:protein-tyrosine phosphatase